MGDRGHADGRTGAQAADGGLDVGPAMLHAERADLDAMLGALAERLAAVPGLAVTVSRRHGRVRRLLGDLPYVNDLHRRADPISSITATIGASRYWLRVEDGSIRCGTDTRTAMGPATEALPFDTWAGALSDAVGQRVGADLEALGSLRRLVEGGPT